MAIETVTIINNSGKIISTGKHLVNIFKEAKASYQEKKASIRAERAVQRSYTYDVAAGPDYHDDDHHRPYDPPRRLSYDDGQSHASSRRSYRSRRSQRTKDRSSSQTRPALTVRNLQTLSEVSSVAPSRPPVTYRSPYCETAPRDMALSRPTLLTRSPTMPVQCEQLTPVSTPRQSMYVNRSRSDPSLKKKKEIDMNLAYGNIPPDLASRVDLDPAYKAAEKEQKAHSLMQHIEGLLTEAHCLHHTATSIIAHLQGNPEAAAAVALTLAELSTLVSKMSPAFLSVIKGGSPAIFALLSSPQFLIAAGVTVGVTVVMFGGWKIVKRIKEAKQDAAMKEQPMAFAEDQPIPLDTFEQQPYMSGARPPYPMTEYDDFDEALVIEEELSTIESWRRGIQPFGEEESVDMELISPEADRAIRSQYGDDARTVRSSRTTKTHKSSKTTKSSKTVKSTRSKDHRAADDMDIPERKSSRGFKDSESVAGSERSHRSHRSERSEKSNKSSRSKKSNLKAIEDGSRQKKEDEEVQMVIRPKKDTMLKNLFKRKKDNEDKVSKAQSESALVFA